MVRSEPTLVSAYTFVGVSDETLVFFFFFIRPLLKAVVSIYEQVSWNSNWFSYSPSQHVRTRGFFATGGEKKWGICYFFSFFSELVESSSNMYRHRIPDNADTRPDWSRARRGYLSSTVTMIDTMYVRREYVAGSQSSADFFRSSFAPNNDATPVSNNLSSAGQWRHHEGFDWAIDVTQLQITLHE